ncbi:MAG TPA: DedA family protein, partial [Cystobacter sp.]
MVEFLDNFITHLGLLGLLVFAVAAALEYVVPPFPGDTITLLGGVYAVRGDHPWPLVFGVVVAGSVLGALINYQVGHWLG